MSTSTAKNRRTNAFCVLQWWAIEIQVKFSKCTWTAFTGENIDCGCYICLLAILAGSIINKWNWNNHFGWWKLIWEWLLGGKVHFCALSIHLYDLWQRSCEWCHTHSFCVNHCAPQPNFDQCWFYNEVITCISHQGLNWEVCVGRVKVTESCYVER